MFTRNQEVTLYSLMTPSEIKDLYFLSMLWKFCTGRDSVPGKVKAQEAIDLKQ